MRPRRMILEATIDGPVIRGTLTLPEAEPRAFHGWLELTTAIEAAVLAAGEGPSPVTEGLAAEQSQQ